MPPETDGIVEVPNLIAPAEFWSQQLTAVALVNLDPVGVIRAFNSGAERLKGYASSEVLGRSFEVFYRAEDQERRLPSTLLSLAASKGFVEDVGWRVRKDGSLFWAQVMITALRGGDGELAGFVKITRDLTAAKRLEDERQQLLQTIAHDLMSPVTALQGYIDLLEEDPDNATAYAERLHAVSAHLVDMTERLREVAGAQDATLTLHPEDVQIADILDEAVAVVVAGDPHERIDTSGVRNASVFADPLSLRRALANVIDNATKYSDGPVVISTAVHGGMCEVRVVDRGRGIAPEDVPTIFEPRRRGRLAIADDGGSGLGLTSVRELMERQQGDIELRSALGVGTTVTLRIPLAASER